MLERFRASLQHRSENKRRRGAPRQSAVRRKALRVFGWEQLERRELLTAAATITWTGGSAASANWSDPANWDLGRAPIDGDSLVFPASAKQLANDDDIAGLSVNSITFQGSFTTDGGYTLSGADLTVDAGGVVDSSSINAANATIANQIDLNITLAVAQIWSIDDDYSYGAHQLTLNGNVDNNGFALTASGTGTIGIAGEITGSGSLHVVGVPAGFTDAMPVGTPFGGLTLDLDHANAYTGGTSIGNYASVAISADGALGPGGMNDAGTTVDQGGGILFNAIAYTTPEAMTVNAGTLAGSGSATFSGPIAVTGSLTLAGNNTSTILAGGITGSGTLTKIGSGTFDLTAANDFTGTTDVNAGTLLVDGSTAAGNAVDVAAGAILGGTGTIGGTTALVPSIDQLDTTPAPGGILDPGAGPDPSKDTGTLSNAGGVTLGSSGDGGPVVGFGRSGPAVFAVQLGGTAASPANDQLDSTGTVFLQFATLDLTALPGAGPFNVGQQFVIVQAGTPISGTFNGLPEASTVSDGIQDFTISYANNRVTLTALPVGTGTITWTGGSTTSDNWSDPANWDLGRAPVDGDSLVFPASAKQLANNDDIAGLSVNSITFQGSFTTDGGYTLNGDDLTVDGGGIADRSYGTGASAAIDNQIDLNVALAAAQTWYIDDALSGHRLAMNGDVANNGFELTVSGANTIDIAGEISGSGRLSVEGALFAVPGDAQTIPPGPVNALTLNLDHANTYTGGTYVNFATVAVSADGALGPGGSDDSGTTVGAGGAIQFNAVAYKTAEAITLNGGSLAGAGNSSFSGPITISGSSPVISGTPPQDAEIVETEPSATFTLNGPTLTNNGAGNLMVRGAELLPQTGEPPQMLANVNVVIDNVISGVGGLTITTAAVALGAANTYQGSTYEQGPATLIVNADNAIPNASAVVMQSYSSPGFSAIELNGHADTIGSLTGTQAIEAGNTIDLGTGGSLTTGGDNTSTTFDGDISGSGTLTKVGSGTFDLTATNGYTGTTYVAAGTLLVDGSTTAGNMVTVAPGATLGGAGTIGGKLTIVGPGGFAAYEGGTLDPGAGPDPSKDTGTLSNTGGVTFQPSLIVEPGAGSDALRLSQFAVQLGGTSANPTNDQLNSAGTVTFVDATFLNLSTLPGAGPYNAGQQFIIVQAGAPITTTFAGLPEGSTVSDGTQDFTISYANDRVTLTAQPVSGATSTYLNGQVGDGTAATFVHNLYRELLGREPDSAGQTYWLNAFAQISGNSGTAAAQQALAADFLGSSEYREHLIAHVYTDFLRRAANSSDLVFWNSELAAGMDERILLADILGSYEYYAEAQPRLPEEIATTTKMEAEAWVGALYRDLLGRTPDPGGLDFWTQQTLANNSPSGRAAIAYEFLGAAELDHKLINGNYPGAAGSVGAPGTPAVSAYALAEITGNGWDNLYFQGTLDAAAVDSLFADLQAGASFDETIAAMLDLPQYLNAAVVPT